MYLLERRRTRQPASPATQARPPQRVGDLRCLGDATMNSAHVLAQIERTARPVRHLYQSRKLCHGQYTYASMVLTALLHLGPVIKANVISE